MSDKTVGKGNPEDRLKHLATRVLDLEVFRLEIAARLAAIESALIGIAHALPLKLEGRTPDLKVHLDQLTEAGVAQAIAQLAKSDPQAAVAITKRREDYKRIRGAKA
jgi:hypothetical protein